MGLERNRRRIFVKGLGTLSVREIEPTPATSFSDVGYLNGTVITDASEVVDVVELGGNFVDAKEQARRVRIETNLLQSTKDEADLLRNAVGKRHALRYYGMENDTSFKYYVLDRARIVPNIPLDYKPGTRLLPLSAVAGYDGETVYGDEYLASEEADLEIRAADLNLWVSARAGYRAGLPYVLDLSGFARHGTLNSDYAAIWQTATTPTRFFRFDGVNDYLDFGDILDDDGLSDFVLEVWVRVTAADGTIQEVFTKKGDATSVGAGFSIIRDASNLMRFRIADGATSVNQSGPSTVLQNVWAHVAVAVDRNDRFTVYVNGSPGSTSSTLAALGSGTNAIPLRAGRDSSNYGQVDIGAIRVYSFAAGGLPSTIATTIARHYNAEKARYGL